MSIKVLVYYPSDGKGFVGMDYASSDDLKGLNQEYNRLVDEGTYVVRLLEMEIASKIKDEEAVIDELDDLVYGNEKTLPAVKQFVPENTVDSAIPVGE